MAGLGIDLVEVGLFRLRRGSMRFCQRLPPDGWRPLWAA
jgi:hypothetical protein